MISLDVQELFVEGMMLSSDVLGGWSLEYMYTLWRLFIVSVKYGFSLAAGFIAAVTFLYSGLAQVWSLPYSSEVTATGSVVVSFLSIVLATITGDKLIKPSPVEKSDIPVFYTDL